MGAVEHLKTLCCLGLKPESAMIAVTPLLHDILPHGWLRMCLLEPDGTIGRGYSENPAMAAHQRERLWRFMDDRLGLKSFLAAGVRANAIGWTLPRQGRNWMDSGWYREMEAPLDSCWILDAMIGDTGRTFAGINMTRPRSARPFTVDDVQRFDRLRPWLAHAFRPQPGDARPEDQNQLGVVGMPVRGEQLILTPDAKVIFQARGVEFLLRVIEGEPSTCTRYGPVCDRLPSQILKLLRCIGDAANGTSNSPPRLLVSTAYGVVTLEAKWLVPAGTIPEDAARDPKSCLIAVTIKLYEHPIAYAARMLRESGATPAQTKVGIYLALGKQRPEIAGELGLQCSSVADHSKKLYQTLDVHNSTELATKIWLNQKQDEARQGLRRAG